MRNTPVARIETFINNQGNEQTRIVESLETVERFHNRHQSSFTDFQIGIKDLNWADRLVFSTGFSRRSDEMQHGARVESRPAGEVELSSSIFFQSLKYEKEVTKKFKLSYFGTYIAGSEDVRDSTKNLYTWTGHIETNETRANGAEILSNPSLRDGNTFATAHRLYSEYEISKNHKVAISNFYAYQRIKGEDPTARLVPLDNPTVDPNTLPSTLSRNVLAGEYTGKWWSKRIETVSFGKYYTFSNRSFDFSQTGTFFSDEPITRSDDLFDFGAGLKASIDENRFFRFAYEQTVRIPTRREVFGDFTTIAPNFGILPERSENVNIGLFYKHYFKNDRFFSLQVDWFFRDLRDLIRLEVPASPNLPASFINQSEVRSQGLEVVINTLPTKNLGINYSFTYQDIVNSESPDTNNTNNSGESIPNIPSSFYNLGATYKVKSPFNKEDQISFFGYYNYVQEFSLIFQGSVRNNRNFIPTQNQLDAGLSYQLSDSGFTFSFQCNNVLDADVFDNYRIPRPNRYYNLKIRFQL
ncbi:MAG: hypothetical protein AAF600_07080 [Bacteroidota bacterium]